MCSSDLCPVPGVSGHYYRIQDEDLLIEYDNTTDDGNHAHTVLRRPRSDFGDDLLADHLRADHLGTDNLRADHLRADHLRADHLRADSLRADRLRDEDDPSGCATVR